jgi:4a-hydroxytetrahydrobiopterin dehydratase
MTKRLTEKRCIPCEGGTKPLTQAEAETFQQQLGPHWKLIDSARKIEAQFEFKNYFRTLAFVNAVAYLVINEDHHPDISFGYKTAKITFWTHTINGLSENDFICAATIDRLLGS